MKTFDSINRQTMFNISRHYGVPIKVVNAIEAICHNSKSAVLVDGNASEEFNVITGVLQGDTLAPFLFIVVIDYVMKNAQLDLEFADHIALLENSLERAQQQLTQLAK